MSEPAPGAPKKKAGFKEPPHSVEAETSALGGLLLDNGLWASFKALPLKAGDFYRPDHRVIYEAIGDLLEAGRSCDFVSLSEHLRQLGTLDQVGGMAQLAQLTLDTYSASSALRHAEIVVERARYRALIEVGRAITAMGFNPENRPSQELTEIASERLAGLLVEILGTGDAEPGAVEGLRPTLPDLVQHYVLIYGTRTVWDERKAEIMSLDSLQAAAARDRVKKWLGHPQRRTVHFRDVVFEPGEAQRAGTVNMFRGLPLKPDPASSCQKLLELLEHLCSTEDGTGEEKPLMDWVLNWLAYPLQHLGAKMQTALLFHGFPGAGKNLLFKALRQIYGQYCTEIGQAQLEFFRFNGWGSRKLLVIGNEVISRSELKHAEGQLRQWISEPTWQVDEKNLPLREEANHVNFIFLSNFVVPLSLGRKDRRMAVLYTPRQEKPAQFYMDVAAELNAGGAAAFLHLLRARDLSGFNEHTKPPMTQAKQDLMEASAESYERFETAWTAGQLPVPFAACTSLDLYKAYRKWCDERGERNPVRDAVFLASLRKRVGTRSKKYTVAEGPMERQVEGIVFLPEGWQRRDGRTEQQTLGLDVMHFRRLLHSWSYDEAKGGEGSGEGSASETPPPPSSIQNNGLNRGEGGEG